MKKEKKKTMTKKQERTSGILWATVACLNICNLSINFFTHTNNPANVLTCVVIVLAVVISISSFYRSAKKDDE